MMRKLFWMLLLGNAVLFAAIQRGWFEEEQQGQPALHGEMIRLVPQNIAAKTMSTPAQPSAKTEPLSPQSKSAPELPSSLQMAFSLSAPAAGRAGSYTPVCKEWGDFSGPELMRVTSTLSALQLGNKLSRQQVERDIAYWVYIPPLKNKASVDHKIGELKALGIKEYFVVQIAGHWHNAISLGVFKTQEAAQNFLNYLHTKGVRTAKVGERASKLKATVFKLNRIDASTEAKLAALQKDYAGSELKTVPCANSGIH